MSPRQCETGNRSSIRHSVAAALVTTCIALASAVALVTHAQDTGGAAAVGPAKVNDTAA